MFSGRWDDVNQRNNEGKMTLDRDPKIFQYLVYFLNFNKIPKLPHTVQMNLYEEFIFWEIPYQHYDSTILKDISDSHYVCD